jgi:hypothetical protein
MPSKQRHAKLAREQLDTARNYEQLAKGSAVSDDVLIMSHCEACAAMANAAQGDAKSVYDRAAEVAVRVGRKLRPNPLTTGSPPVHVQGLPGSSQVWRYKGRELLVERDPGMTTAPWKVTWITDEGDEESSYGVDAQAALANARYNIDVVANDKKWPGYYSAETAAHHVLDNYVDFSDDPVDRATVARLIEQIAEQFRRDPNTRPNLYGPRTLPIRKFGIDAFYSLPIKERLRLIDELIDYQYRWGFFGPERYKPTPSKGRVKNPGKKRNTRAERRRILRRLLRV